MPRLNGKVCVITGAGGGMGRDAAILFTEEGARVCAADVNRAAAEETMGLCADGSAFAFEVNVADEQQVAAMMRATAERFGGIDVLYNNAGISPDDDASVLDTSVEAWDRVQAVNTKGVFLCCKHGIPYLRERGGGSVINVASFVAIVGAATSQISYTASKGAVLSMSRELAVQFAREGIRVNALCPGPVETPLLLNIFGDNPSAHVRDQMGARAEQPLDAVVLVVAPGVVQRAHQRVAERDLPRDQAQPAQADEGLPVEQVPMEVRRGEPRLGVPLLLLVEAGVAVG